MGRQVFEADGRVLGEREVENFRNIPGFSIKITDSFCYFCPHCGEVWGRLRHIGATYWQCIYRNCAQHGDGRLSMVYPAGQPLGVAEDWPREALLREFLLELELIERQI